MEFHLGFVKKVINNGKLLQKLEFCFLFTAFIMPRSSDNQYSRNVGSEELSTVSY